MILGFLKILIQIYRIIQWVNLEKLLFYKLVNKNIDWQVNDFEKPAKEDLVIYEVLIRDFDSDRNFQDLIDKIEYFKNLNINAIELMPVMEFEGMKVGDITLLFIWLWISIMEHKISLKSLLIYVIAMELV